MKLIVGLGNPGEKYKSNRHNVGFMFIDYLVNELTGSRIYEFKLDKKDNSQLAKLVINNNEIILAKPLTFMNLSGKAVKKIIRNWKLEIRNLVIVHDDLDIPLAKFKIQKGIGPKLHNGIESIENALSRKDFWRVRIGVDNRFALSERSESKGWIDGETYTLQDFKPEEKKIIWSIFPKIVSRLKNELLPKFKL